jgi:NAD(P)-dependent dehydrogenase (short-subunit alcohol dehydrogenase family)
MNLQGARVLVTGAGNGLGRGMALAFAARGASVVVVDIDAAAARAVADEVGGAAVEGDLGRRSEVERVIAAAEAACGPLDVYCSNAALSMAGDLLALDDERWEATWHLNVMSHVWAARALLPSWLERGSGCLFQTVSAIALTLNHWDAPYAVTKRGALAFNEYLATRYGGRGILVCAFCPRGMLTDRLLASVAQGSAAGRNAMRTAVTPERAGEIAADGIEREQFLILTEEEEIESHRRKATGYDEWLTRRRAQVAAEAAGPT